MAAVPIIALAAGGLMSAVGAINQGNSAKAAADYNAQVAEQNAELSRQQGIEEERRTRIMAKKQLGDMRANYGASGITLEGSPLDILEESAAAAELDALTVRHAGDSRAIGYRNEAAQERFSGRQARTSGYFSASGSLLSGAGQAMAYKRTS
jgi:hypothetical protein